MKRSMMRLAPLLILPVLPAAATSDAVSDLTIRIAGDLLEHGGVVVVHHLPVEAAEWDGLEAEGAVRIDRRFAEVQLRYPAEGTFAYRFHPDPMTEEMEGHTTQVLSVIGTDLDGVAQGMEIGFVGSNSAGGRVIRVPPRQEILGADEATRTSAKWGVTERRDEPPPADERSARGLAHLLEFETDPSQFECEGNSRVQTCTVAEANWAGVEALWWRTIAEMRLERLRDRALRQCYDGPTQPAQCEGDPDADEPAYLPAD